MPDPMRIRTELKDGVAEIKVLMAHPMETGFRKDTSGNTVPAHFIRRVTATCAGRTVLAAQWGPAVAQNPFLQFRVHGAAAGDTVRITWVDNRGESRTDEATLA